MLYAGRIPETLNSESSERKWTDEELAPKDNNKAIWYDWVFLPPPFSLFPVIPVSLCLCVLLGVAFSFPLTASYLLDLNDRLNFPDSAWSLSLPHGNKRYGLLSVFWTSSFFNWPRSPLYYHHLRPDLWGLCWNYTSDCFNKPLNWF